VNALAAVDVPRGTPELGVLEIIELDRIDIGDNVRDDAGDLTELAASILEVGVQQPVKVTRQAKGRYQLVFGQRRVLASREAGLTTIPAIVEAPSDVDQVGARRSIEQLAENLQRKDLNPIEEAVALREVLDADPELTQAELARRLGMSAPWVSNALRLLQADEVVVAGVREGSITASHAKALVVLPATEQRRLAEQVKTGMSAHNLESTIRWKVEELKTSEARAKRTEKAIPRAIAALEAAGTEKGTEVYIEAYSLDRDAVAAALRKAGWPPVTHYAWARGAEAKCDCRVVRLAHNRAWSIEPGCIEDKHRDRQRNADHVAQRAEEERRGRQAQVIRDAIERDLRAAGFQHAMVDLLWRATRSSVYYGDKPSDLIQAIAQAATADWRLREVDVPALLAELGLQDPEVAIEAPAPPKPAKPAPKISAKALAAARADLDLNGAD
jgi:ParB family chromosome partitioning protein